MTEYIVDLAAHNANAAMALCDGVHQPIVRCRDCKRVTIDQGDHDYREPLWCGLFRIDVSLDGFCKWGERRSE